MALCTEVTNKKAQSVQLECMGEGSSEDSMKTRTWKMWQHTRQGHINKMSKSFQKAASTYTSKHLYHDSHQAEYHRQQTIQSLVPIFILLFHLLRIDSSPKFSFKSLSQVPISSKKVFPIPFNVALLPPLYLLLHVVTLLLCFLYFTFYQVIHKPRLSTLF